ncbi:sensor histidine kinase [Streptomyces sp. NPDC007264]|uniref:sensor histidine kinase n=1 Tax=Streptomyces sp. NPDC007264 TaxID=3364777 RepID=UPI0036DB39E1
MPAEHPRLVFAGWVLFAVCSQLLLFVVPHLETVAFHLVWISMSIVYGFQGWSVRRMAVVLTVTVLVTGTVLGGFVARGHAEWDELAEVPLMALVFLAMVWHVRRRAAALAQTQSLVERERRAQEVKELFVRNCSHEMRTPITVARCYAEMVRDALPTPRSREDLDVVVDELDKLGGLAGRLLVLADAYESTAFEWGPVDLGSLLRRTVQRWRPASDRDWHWDAPSVLVEGDESRLEAALDALVENAVKFTAEGDAIVLRCRGNRSGAVVEVEDTGIGFARSRADDGSGPPRSSGRPGTGLGLAIVRAVVEGHGGRLTTVSDRPSGALLRMTLPLRPPATGPRPAPPDPPARRHRPGTPSGESG